MLRIAIVEDEPDCARQLQAYLERYQRERELEMNITHFSDGIELAERYTPEWDILFLDIQMKLLDGMDTARRIRVQDPCVTIVFITNLARYAIQGYEVDASDYILKPLNYDRFRVRMEKITAAFRRNREEYVMLPLGEQKVRLPVREILYVEVLDHELQVVTEGQSFRMRGSLRKMEQLLEGQGFSRCNRCYLVNLRQVTRVGQNDVCLGEHTLPISRPRKKEFLRELSECLGAEL